MHGAKTLADAVFHDNMQFTAFMEKIIDYEPQAFELLAKLDLLLGSDPCQAKAPLYLLISIAKSVTGDMQQSKFFSDACQKLLIVESENKFS